MSDYGTGPTPLGRPETAPFRYVTYRRMAWALGQAAEAQAGTPLGDELLQVLQEVADEAPHGWVAEVVPVVSPDSGTAS